MIRRQCTLALSLGLALLLLLTACQTPETPPPDHRKTPTLGKQQPEPAPRPAPPFAQPPVLPPPGSPGAPPAQPAWAYMLRTWERYGTQPSPSGQVLQTFVMHLQAPEFPDPRLAGLNRFIQQYIEQVKADFLQRASNLNAGVLATSRFPWTLDVKFSIAHSGEKFLSLLFELTAFMGGATRDVDFYTLNYSVEPQAPLAIEDLFPSTDGLKLLSALTLRELNLRREPTTDPALITRGAGPDYDNFRRFTLAPGQLVIHFPPGQVSALAAGPKQVALPLSTLRPMLAPQILPLLP